ncbi:MAG: tripartite tricarboxylate transporter substrate binding protein [Aquabacterium sp.]|nr:tripartite tricarboxylate transporter substrate binding protein [Aquabacterium sp.]MBP8150671.1 tripartite tricarboxylate transporter substrate binding protein [Xylophilus sp.]
MQQTKTTLTALALGLLASAAVAQTYPAKPVTIVVPYSAGGPVDNFIRALGQQLSDSWKQPVVVLNKPGANEIIGADHVAKSAPDGYTLFAGTEASLTMSPHLYKKLPYNVDTDFVPISQLVSLPLMLFTHKNTPASTVSEFVDLARKAKAQGKPLSYGSTGAGGIAHLPIVTFEKQEGISMTHVPYRGAANLIPDVIAGQVDVAVLAVSVIEQHVKTGALKPLAVSSETRSVALPQVPTFKEAGFKDIHAIFSIGLLAPKGTPAAVIDKIAASTRAIITTPDFRQKNIDAFSYVPVASSPVEFKAFLSNNSKLQAERVKASGVTLD